MTLLDDACITGAVVAAKDFYGVFGPGAKVPVPPALAQPYLVSTGSWNDATPEMYAYKLDLASIMGNSLWAGHLGGYAYMRATWCFRLEVASSPFNGGWLKLVHQPPNQIQLPPSSVATVSRLCQYPGVELDIATANACELRIPHRALDPWLHLQPSTSVLYNGFISIVRRTPLNQGSGSLPRWSLWMWFEDVELDGAAVANTARANVQPQSGSALRSLEELMQDLRADDAPPPPSACLSVREVEVVATVLDMLSTVQGAKLLVRIIEDRLPAEAQAGRSRAGEVTQQGPLSAFLLATSGVAEWVGTKVPLLTSYAYPLSWAARMGAKVAAAFGYSRPLPQAPIVQVREALWGHFNATGIETAYVAGAAHDTQVPPVPLAGVMEDQMSLAFLTSLRFPAQELSIPDTTPAGKLIMSGALTPLAMYRHFPLQAALGPLHDWYSSLATPVSGTVGISSVVPSPALWAASWFTFWRGSIKLRFLLSKTKMHTGRMALIWDYHPVTGFVSGVGARNSPNIFLPTTLQASHPSNRVVVDLAETTTFEVTIPWACAAPLLPIAGSYGSWGLYMMDPISHPTSTANNIHVAVEMSFSDDVFFAGPKQSFLVPDDSGTQVLAQSGTAPYGLDLQRSAEADYNKAVGVKLVGATVGENVTSMKQLAMLPVPYSLANATYDSIWFTKSVLRDANDQYQNPNRNCVLDHLRRFYAVERGSLVITHVLKSGQADDTIKCSAYDYRGTPTVGDALITVVERLSNAPRIVCPRYSPTGGSYNRRNVMPIASLLMNGTFRTPGAYNAKADTYLSAADDYMATVFCTTLPCFVRFTDMIPPLP
nr:MAG: capsid protein [Sanya dicistro-like virus 3]